jgi:hypothetical protein
LTGEDLCDKSGDRLIRIILFLCEPEELILSENTFGARMSEGSIYKGGDESDLTEVSHKYV